MAVLVWVCCLHTFAQFAAAKFSPVIFNSNETAGRAEVFGVQGAGFGAGAELWCTVVSGKVKLLKPTVKLKVLSASEYNLSALIPDKPAFKAGVLIAVWVKRTMGGRAWSKPVFLNRARGVTIEYDRIMPGQAFRIFGRNLRLKGFVPGLRFVEVKTRESFPARITGGDPFVLNVIAPAAIMPGSRYQLVLSNGNGSGIAEAESTAEELMTGMAAAADPFGLKVPWGTEFTFYKNIYNVKSDPRLQLKAKGDGETNDRQAIQQAIDLASRNGGGVVYFPEGKYKLDIPSGSGLIMRSRVVLKGEGDQKTFIQYGFGTPPPYPDPIGKDGWPNATTEGVAILWPVNTTLSGLYQLCLQNVNTSGLWRHSLKTMPPPVKKPGGSGSRFFAANCRFDFSVAWGLSWAYVDRMIITDCDFDSKARITWPWLWHCTGSTNFVVRNNRLRYAAGRFGFNDSFNGIIENNHITRQGDLINPKGETGGFNIDFAQDIVVMNNRLDVEGKAIPDLNQGETILSQGGNPEQMFVGKVSAATANTLTDRNQQWGQIKTPSLSSSDAVAIVYGRGMGQWRHFKSNTKNTLQLTRHWDVIPDATSCYAIMHWSAEDWLVKDNILENNNRGIWFYCGSTDVAITGNQLNNSEGIYIRSDQRLIMGRYNLSWNVSVTDNQVINTNGLRPAFICNVLALGTKPDTLFGAGSIGVEIRRNLVQAHQPNSGSFVRAEGYFNEVLPKNAADSIKPGVTGVIGTIFEKNKTVNTDIGYRLYGPIGQTIVKDAVVKDVPTPLTKAAGTVFLKEGITESPTIVLKDHLVHPAFSWPLSLLQYELDFGTEGALQQPRMLIEKSSGRQVPFQLSETAGSRFDQTGKKAILSFLSDLPSGSTKTFELLPATKKVKAAGAVVHVTQTADVYQITNGKIRIEIPAHPGKKMTAAIRRYGNTVNWLGHGEIPALPVKEIKVDALSAGPVHAVFRISYTFDADRQYNVLVKLTAGMEFAELEEEMKGFNPGEGLSWKMVWDGIRPEGRYVSTRVEQPGKKQIQSESMIWEPMEGRKLNGTANQHPEFPSDQQNGREGLLPFQISPYDNWLSWWRMPSAAFRSERENTTIGLFIKDNEKWNDGKYALWASKKDLSISFHWNNSILDYTFPMVTGTRSTALAAYGNEREQNHGGNQSLAYIDELRRWYGWIPLDKVKNWILNYDAPETGYPRFFKPENAAKNLTVASLESSLSDQLGIIGSGSERINGPNPVSSRIYYDQIVPAFDLNAGKMSVSQYQKLRSWYLFVSYLYRDEALMPVRNLLSGHPNFLSDIKGVTGLAAFLFPKHPEAAQMADHFGKVVQLNFNYHIRPDVPAWGSLGGRWTENLATYTWAALTPAARTNYLLQHHFDGKNRMLQPGVSMLGNWLLNAVSSPLTKLDNKRVYPPQGAHARSGEDGPPDVLRVLGQELTYYDPLLSEHLLWFTRAGDKPFESTKEKNKAWRDLLSGEWENNKGSNPKLKSAKFTGYGFILRSAFGTKDEMYVNLQQIDEGPNYRWGRAAMGGNGVIYYYAGGKRYSHNGAEDVGDGPFGDTERISNFGVKKPGGYRSIGAYRSVGRNDLTEPLYDFGFAQFASIRGNKEISGAYHSRSVLQSAADYIAVFDEVPDEKTEGRFSWFVGANDEFPYIHQVTPGAPASDANLLPSKSNYHTDPAVMPTKGRYYDGKGSFLTVVTHKPEIRVKKTDFGCIILKNEGETDLVFRALKALRFANDGLSFKGKAGIIQMRKGITSAALFEGSELSVPGLKIELAAENKAGISMQSMLSGYTGTFQSQAPEKVVFTVGNPKLSFYLDGEKLSEESPGTKSHETRRSFSFPSGKHTWTWSNAGVRPAAPEITTTIIGNQQVLLKWNQVAGADSYRMELSKDGELNWETVGDQLKGVTASVADLKNNSKIHLRVIAQGKGGDSEPSDAYPAYITGQPPHAPEGLLLDLNSSQVKLSWGSILGAGSYRLYRRTKAVKSDFNKIYEGADTFFADQKPSSGLIYEYRVTAINGNGESSYSPLATTDPKSFINWAPKGGEGFRRDTENHENGFPEYNPFKEDEMPVLIYPINKK